MSIEVKRSKDDKYIELVKQYQDLDFDDETMIRSLNLDASKVVTIQQLHDLQDKANKKRRDNVTELNAYIKHVITEGQYDDIRKQIEVSDKMLNYNYKRYLMAVENGDDSLIMQYTNIISKQMTDRRSITTSYAYMDKSKQFFEQAAAAANNKSDGDTVISLESKSSNFDDVIDQTMNAIELEKNKVF
jgi:predicted Mrr-cat superfamily restriction endonuclease